MIQELYSAYLDSSGICTDTRKVDENKMFVALKGSNFNGNDYALSSLEAGCSYAIVDENRADLNDLNQVFLVENALETLQALAKYHRKKLKIPVIGLTGSNGKTTTKELLHASLSSTYNCYATKGNFNNHIGVPLSLLEITNKHEIAIIEMGANHQKEIAQLSRIADPNLGLITNIGLAHLEGFGGEHGVYIGKKELFDYLIEKNGSLFINSDDEKVIRATQGVEGITYGASKNAIYQGSANMNNGRLEVKWKREDEETENSILTQLTGIYNFSNVMAAIAVSRYFGISNSKICKSIEAYSPTNNRSQLEITTKGNTLIIDCYNANPNSMSAALENLEKMDCDNRIAILGEMKELGESTRVEHENIINQLLKSKSIEKVYLVGEAFHHIDNKPFKWCKTTEELKDHLVDANINSSTILLKGSRSTKLETLLELL